jgi:hypothetical protein
VTDERAEKAEAERDALAKQVEVLRAEVKLSRELTGTNDLSLARDGIWTEMEAARAATDAAFKEGP